MELVLFTGIQATGKSHFCRERFYFTHMRINLDMLRTRRREQLLVKACLEAKQRFVVDNTNLTRQDRARYISAAKQARFRVIGYYFSSETAEALQRNAARFEARRVPDKAIWGASRRLEVPSFDEGFDELHFVRISGDRFIVEKWKEAS